MEKKERKLQYRILAGYFALLAVAGGLTAIMLYERAQIRKIEAGVEDIRRVRRDMDTVRDRIIRLSLLGEGVMGWREADYLCYCTYRLRTDSLLLSVKPRCAEYVHPAQIDTLRTLLADKETHLRHVMEAVERQDEADSLLVNRLPEVARRATRVRTVTRKKSGLAGVFGGKKKVQVLPSAGELHKFSDNLIELQRRQAAEMDACSDSLRVRNRALNAELERLIHSLDTQAREAFAKRERKISEAQALSAQLFTATLSAAIVLLLLSYLAIHREMKRNADERKERERLIGELQESKRTNDELARFRRNLIRNVTHELRTPLTAIGGNAELLLNDTEADSRMRHAQAVRNAAGRMAGMINDLLVYFRLDSGKETPNIKPFRLRSVAETLQAEFGPLAEGKRLFLRVECRADEIVCGDRSRILSIGSNLLSNAIKFTPSGTVALSTDYKDGTFTLTVDDTGTGMTEEQLTLIFKPFERLGNAVTEDGFGLGLAIVRHLVRLMGGTVRVESVPGKGSRFTVTLPLPVAQETATGGKTGMKHPALSGSSVLAIDNNGMLLDMMKEMYRQSGVECDTCQSVDGLTDLMRMKDYDLLITDLKMPEMNGYEVLELLRTSEIGNSQTIPIVAATAAGYVKEGELKAKGFAAVLYKPYSIGELLAVTENCVKPKGINNIDLSHLLAFGDRRRTLEKLAITTQSDMDGVRKAAEAGDLEALDGWIHHLRSSWMLIKAEQPLAALYEAIHKENIKNENVQSAINGVLEQGSIIMEMARKEAERWDG